MSRSLAITGFFEPSQMVGGVASYWQNLTRGVNEVVGADPRFRGTHVTVFHGPAGVPARWPGIEYRQTGNGSRLRSEIAFGLRASAGFDAVLFPNYFRPPIMRAARSTAVLHDLLYKHMPELFAGRKRLWLHNAQRYALRHCDSIVTISETVRQDVLRWFGDRWAEKTRAIWNPIAFERLEGDAPPFPTGGRPYVLAVAVDRPFKNLATLIQAFDRLRPRFPDHVLVLAGELRARRPKGRIHSRRVAARMPPTVDLVKRLGLEQHVLITGFVPDEQLGALYRGADAFVLPSLFEGFGMPAVESVALGTPTVVSDIPVLREATQGLAIYLEAPRDADAVAEQLSAVLRDPAAARPAPAAISRMRRLFAPATIATQYLETLFGVPPAPAPESLLQAASTGVAAAPAR
ncbi:MAG TPA: glycosyltransferase family 1 protein [Lacipirellulaceae bacterium]|nr:glycosyltransferase family 1 protein [Lacipirellulaceae bacterium]